MPKKKKNSAKRFGPRYGKKIRENISEAERDSNKPQECPECGKKKLEKKSAGIWKCRSCGAKIAGGAFKPKTEVGELKVESEEKSEEGE